MQESNIQLARPTKNVIMAVLTPKSVIELTAFTKFWDRQKAEFFMLYLCAFLPPTIHFCRSKEKFFQVSWAVIDIVKIPSKHSSKHFDGQLMI